MRSDYRWNSGLENAVLGVAFAACYVELTTGPQRINYGHPCDVLYAIPWFVEANKLDPRIGDLAWYEYRRWVEGGHGKYGNARGFTPYGRWVDINPNGWRDR